jgi:hypothetical protein
MTPPSLRGAIAKWYNEGGALKRGLLRESENNGMREQRSTDR